MKNDIQNVEDQKVLSKRGHQISILTVIVVLTCATLLWFGWKTWSSYRTSTIERNYHHKIEKLSHTIIHLDEVLTMSARMAASTGNLIWEKRYRSYEPELDAAIKEAIRLAPEAFSSHAAAETDAANIKLVEMENRSFDLVRQGHIEEAKELLFGYVYEEQKRIYAQGMADFTSGLGIISNTILKGEQRQALLHVGIVFLIIILLLIVWFAALRTESKLKKTLISKKELEKEIVERRRVEEALLNSEERFRGIAESMSDWVWEVNSDAQYTFCSGSIEKILGYTIDEIIGKMPFDFMDQEEAEMIKKVFKMHTPQKKPIKDLENWNISKEGQPVCLLTNGVPILNDNGSLIGYRGINKDITELKKSELEKKNLQKQLVHAQKMESVGQLAGGIAHDFNNILYPIIGFSQLSQNELSKDHPVQENLTDIIDGAKRARDLVKRILHFSRQKKPELKPTILQPVITEAKKLLRSTIPSNIDLQVNFYDGKDAVLCDDSEIHEILLNLCTNSYHAIPGDQGQIIINLDKKNPPIGLDLSSGDYLCLSVKDNGVGISEKIKNNIFEPYMTTKDVGEGSGLGLSVVYGIVQNYNGGIKVESSLETGTIFEIFLPITNQDVEIEEHETIKDPTKSGSEHILFIDDEASIVKLGVRALKSCGYRVTGVNDCTEVLEMFKANQNEFDLIITDMAMPNITGSELSKKILKLRPDIPIIICSGYSERLEKEKVRNLDVSAFLDKPLSIDDLIKITREVLDKQKT